MKFLGMRYYDAFQMVKQEKEWEEGARGANVAKC